MLSHLLLVLLMHLLCYFFFIVVHVQLSPFSRHHFTSWIFIEQITSKFVSTQVRSHLSIPWNDWATAVARGLGQTSRRTHRWLPWEVQKLAILPWLVWVSGVDIVLQTKRSPVPFLVREHAWHMLELQARSMAGGVQETADWCSSHILMFCSLSPSLPSPFSNK